MRHGRGGHRKKLACPELDFALDLALAFGCTLQELGDRMTAREFDLWIAKYRRHPWGEQRADLRAGIIAAAVANYAGKMRKEGTPPAVPTDFMPYVDKPTAEPETDEEPDPMEHFGRLIGN